jgi:hypothetical protein
METALQIDVATLDAPHRRALEEVIGQQLASNQRLVINVMQITIPAPDDRPAQSLDDWTRVYDGLSDSEVDAIDVVVNTRANLTRDLP